MAMEIIDEGGVSELGQSDESNEDRDDIDTKSRDKKVEEDSSSKRKGVRPPPLDVLDRVKMNQPNETPRSTIKGFLKISKNTELRFSRDNLKKVEEQLRQAFSVFYQKLRLLKSFRYMLSSSCLSSFSILKLLIFSHSWNLRSFLNTLAFSKIMKKYDKVLSVLNLEG